MTAHTGWDVTGYYAAQLLPEVAPPDTAVRVAETGIITPRPLQIGDILGGAFRAVRYAPITMFGVTLVGVLIAQVLAVGGGVVLARAINVSEWSQYFGGLGAMATWTVAVMYLTIPLATVILGISLAYGVHEAVFGRRARPGEAIRRLGARLGATLGYAGLVTAVVLVLVAIGVLLINTATVSRNVIWIVVLVFVWLAASVVGLWLSIRLLAAPAVIAIEQLGPIRAIRRSWELTRGNFWRFLGIYLAASMLISFATNMVSSVFSFGGMLLSINNPGVGMVVTLAASSITTLVLALPLTTATTTLLYVDARIRHEGYDLQITEALYG